MKMIYPATTCFFLFAMLSFFSITVYGQNEFSKLATSTDSTFGYTNLNPLKLKKGNPGKSIDYSLKFLAGLKTTDNQTLTLLSRSTTKNPNYKEPKIQINNRYNGMPISGKSGLLDKYVFITSITKDTLTLFVDICKKGNLSIPVGLKFEQ